MRDLAREGGHLFASKLGFARDDRYFVGDALFGFGTGGCDALDVDRLRFGTFTSAKLGNFGMGALQRRFPLRKFEFGLFGKDVRLFTFAFGRFAPCGQVGQHGLEQDEVKPSNRSEEGQRLHRDEHEVRDDIQGPPYEGRATIPAATGEQGSGRGESGLNFAVPTRASAPAIAEARHRAYTPQVPTTDSDTAALLRAREQAESARLAAENVAILARLPAARRHLVERFSVRQVWLFGSRVSGPLHEASDVDLAVVGLDSRLLHRAHAEVEDILRWPVDLIRMEEAHESLLAHIHAEGRLL